MNQAGLAILVSTLYGCLGGGDLEVSTEGQTEGGQGWPGRAVPVVLNGQLAGTSYGSEVGRVSSIDFSACSVRMSLASGESIRGRYRAAGWAATNGVDGFLEVTTDDRTPPLLFRLGSDLHGLLLSGVAGEDFATPSQLPLSGTNAEDRDTGPCRAVVESGFATAPDGRPVLNPTGASMNAALVGVYRDDSGQAEGIRELRFGPCHLSIDYVHGAWKKGNYVAIGDGTQGLLEHDVSELGFYRDRPPWEGGVATISDPMDVDVRSVRIVPGGIWVEDLNFNTALFERVSDYEGPADTWCLPGAEVSR